MQVAEILSDITSLRVCGHNEALALVNVHRTALERDSADPNSSPADENPAQDRDDLRRAKELVELHHEVKARHANGTVDEDLNLARQNVQRVLHDLINIRS